MNSLQESSAAAEPLTDVSAQIPAHEHPTVWAFVGKERYLQAAFCRSTADLYAARFDKTTIKSLSNIAARCGKLTLLAWCRDVGCIWDESLYVSAAEGGSTSVMVMDWLSENRCTLPSEPKKICNAAAGTGHIGALQWLDDRGLWYKGAGEAAASFGNLDALEWQLVQRKSRTGKYGSEASLYTAACEAGQLEVVEWLQKRGFPWDVRNCVKVAIEHGHLDILRWFHARNLLPLNETTAAGANTSGGVEVLEYLHALGCPLLSNESLTMIRMFLHVTQLRSIAARLQLGKICCLRAALVGDLDMLKHLRTIGCPWNSDTLRVARLFSNESANHRIIAEWALENGCPEPET